MTEQTPTTIGNAIADAITAATGFDGDAWSTFPPTRSSLDAIICIAMDGLCEGNQLT